MALDEPKNEDQIIDRGAYKFLLDSQITGQLAGSGGLQVDYVEEEGRQGYLLKVLGSSDCGCDCGSQH